MAGRTAEIGTRVALGARPAGVIWLIMRQSFVLIALGFVIGVPLALLAARALRAQLFGVDPFDPLALAAPIATLAVAGILASLLPARRAVRINPLTALRSS